MLGSSEKSKAMKTLKLGTQFVDDPTKAFIFVYGREGGTTTTFANSIIKMLPEDKRVYILLTEPPHNATAPIKKHFPKEWNADRFVLPLTEDGKSAFPVTTRAEVLLFPAALRKAPDVGAIIIDALDTLRLILYKHWLAYEISLKAWGDADNDIVNMFLDLVTMDVPVIVIMKEKEETITKTSGGKIESIEKTGEIVPSFDKAKILRWASMKFHILRKGRFEVTKTKGLIEEGEKFSYSFKTEGKKNLYDQLTGTWLPEILRMMKVE